MINVASEWEVVKVPTCDAEAAPWVYQARISVMLSLPEEGQQR